MRYTDFPLEYNTLMNHFPAGRPRLNTIHEWVRSHAQGPLLLQLCLYGVIVMVTLLFLLNHPAGLAGWRIAGTVAAMAGLAGLNAVCVRPGAFGAAPRKATREWAYLLLSSAVVLATVWLGGLFEAAYLLGILCAQAGLMRGTWPAGALFAAANLLAWYGLERAMGTPQSIIVQVQSSLATGIVYALLLAAILSRYARQTRRAETLLGELQAANAALEAAHRWETELALAEERVRLAREIHDGLGHHLTVLSIQLQAAGKLVERDPGAAGEAIQACRAETQAALNEVRHSVGLMRQSPAAGPVPHQAGCDVRPLPEALAALVRDFGQHTGLQATFALSGTPVDLALPARQTLYRAAQEGLTNTQKHARDALLVAVTLAYEPGAVRLAVHDDGRGVGAEPDGPAGFGLAGLRERAAQLGGAFDCGPGEDGGFAVELRLPIAGREGEP